MIEKIENDKANPSFELLDKLADAYHVRIGDLLPNSGAGRVEDLCAPILSAMLGLDDRTVGELILNLADQARIQASWRRQDVNTSTLPIRPKYDVASGSEKSDGEAQVGALVGAGSTRKSAHVQPDTAARAAKTQARSAKGAKGR